MADDRYKIDFSADLTPALGLLGQAIQNSRSAKRADAYLDMERTAVKNREARESAAAKRQADNDKYARDVAAFGQLPTLERMARKSPGAANMNPYGFKFNEEQAPEPPNPVEPFVNAPQQQQAPTPQAGALSPIEEGPEQNPVAEAIHRDPTADLMNKATAGSPHADNMMAQAAANAFGPQPKRLVGSFQGQKFDVPEQSDTTGFGPEYDRMYEQIVAHGEDPVKAFQVVAAEHRAQQTQNAIAARTAQQIDARSTAQTGRQDFTREENAKYRSTEQERRDIAAGHDRARIAGAREQAANPLKIDTANRQDMGTLRQAFKDWKNTVNLSVDSKSHKRLATAMSNLDSGNSMQQREAAESLVSIFKGGGQVTKASQDLLLHHLAGIVGDAQSWLQQHASGHFGDAELNVLRQATQNALKEEQEKLHAYHESAIDTFGPGSGYEQMGGNVNSMIKGAFKQFGYDAPDIYQGAEPVVLGSGERPKAPPKKAPAMTDDQAVQLARKRYKANPNDETAKRVLQMHGEL